MCCDIQLFHRSRSRLYKPRSWHACKNVSRIQQAWLRFIFPEALYGKQHPYGRAISDYVEIVSTIEQQDLRTFHQQNFTPHGAAIVVVGDTDTVLELIQTHFRDWSGTSVNQKTPRISQIPSERKIVHTITDKVQTDIVIGCRAVQRSHPDFDILRVANTVLGRFGMMGRLGLHVREELGIAY